MIGMTQTWLNFEDKWGYWWIIFLREVTFEKVDGTTHDLAVLTCENRIWCNARNITKHPLNWLKGVRWLTRMDRLEDKLKTQTVQICKCKQVPCSKVDCRVLPYKQMKTIPLFFNFPTSKGECLFFIFMSPKRVTNTHWSSSSDESILIFLRTLERRDSFPK